MIQEPSSAIRFERVTRWFSTTTQGVYTAIENVSFDVSPGAFLAVVGPSGCGKSTVLNLAAGLIAPSEGKVEIHGERLSGLNRRASYMFQQDALLPWKTVLQNVALGLQLRGRPRKEAEESGRAWLEKVGLQSFSEAFPHQLSGGMRKRAALAQNWIVDPDILLMDEPFSALDVHTRLKMQQELLDLWSGSKKTILFVTHDLEEAIALSDQVVVLSAGPASHVVNRYEVDLARPRNLIDLRTQSDFLDLYRHVWADLRKEVLKSYERKEKPPIVRP